MAALAHIPGAEDGLTDGIWSGDSIHACGHIWSCSWGRAKTGTMNR